MGKSQLGRYAPGQLAERSPAMDPDRTADVRACEPTRRLERRSMFSFFSTYMTARDSHSEAPDRQMW